VTLTGTGAAGQTITIYDGSYAIKTVTVAADGTWSAIVSLGIGTHADGEAVSGGGPVQRRERAAHGHRPPLVSV
jgi:hypothetical protein